MNYIKQLTAFFNKAAADPRLSPTHISLFMALFQLWNQSRFAPSIQIARDDVMRLAKINSKATYHKAIGYLHQNFYIIYQPSYNPFKGSKIEFLPEADVSVDEPVQEINTRLLNEPYNKQYKSIYNQRINNLSIDRSKKEEQKMTGMKNKPGNEKEKSSAKKEIPPVPTEVEKFFLKKGSTSLEADRFINHYTANGWLVGGKSPMINWEASANNWISNSINFNRHANKKSSQTVRAKNLSTQNEKDYFEPL